MNINSDITEFANAAIVPDQAHHGGDLNLAKSILAKKPQLNDSHPFLIALLTGQSDRVISDIGKNPELATQEVGPKSWPPILYGLFSMYYRDDLTKRADFLAIAKELIQNRADPNSHFIQDGASESVLYAASGIANDPAMTQLLLQVGANPDDPEASYHVAEFNNTDCAKLLFEHGMSEDLKATTVLRKLDFEDYEGFQKIAEMNCDMNAQGQWGKSPLHQAVIRGRSDRFIQLILDHGADINIKNSQGQTAYELAVAEGRKSTVNLLLKNGADPN